MKSVVFLKKFMGDTDLQDQFARSFILLSLSEEFDKAKAIFIKPNLTFPVYKKGVTTRREFVECLIKALRNINSKTKIYIGEGEGGYNSFSMSEAFENMGFFSLEKKFSLVKIINLSEMPSKAFTIDTPRGSIKIELPEIFFNEIDFSISCPVPKVHCMTKITLAYKNLWGCLPDTMRLKNHYVFNEIISQICKKLKFRYAFLDGKYGLDKNGPIVGDPVEVNWFAASNSLGAFDIVVSEMMGFDWRKISHLKMALRSEFIAKKENIEIFGDIDALKKKFVLKRNFWNYTALGAFRSKKLTYLVYFSRLAKLIHDIMYIVRKRPIE